MTREDAAVPDFDAGGSEPVDWAGGGLLALAVSLAGSFGVARPHSGLADGPAAPTVRLAARLQARPDTVVLLVLDGVGLAQLAAHVPTGALARARIAELDSVYPTSTAPAITTLATAMPPAIHTNTGWFVRSGAQVVRSLPMDLRTPPGGDAPAGLWGWRAWTVDAPAQCHALQPAGLADSAFSQRAFAGCRIHGYRGLDHLATTFEALMAEPARERRYFYVYVPDFDSIAHQCGWRSDAAGACLAELDRLFERLAQVALARRALLIATADHGFDDIDPDRQHVLADHPKLACLLDGPLSGEPRVVFCHVRPEARARFPAVARELLAGIADVHPSAMLAKAGWFGPGVQPPTLRERLGDFTLVMRPGHTLTDSLPGEPPATFVGMHGGATSLESRLSVAAVGP